MSAAAATPPRDPHIPVLLAPLLRTVAPVGGVWVDGTFGAGGYARGLIEAGADKVIGIDRDPLALEMAAAWLPEYDGRIELHQANFAEMDQIASDVDGVVLDLGVSSMQIDQAERGFSFMKDGPLDMRMGQDGPSAEDIVNDAPEALIADILFHYGEERAARRIAKAIVSERLKYRINSTKQLVDIIEGCLPRKKPGQSHPATRSFQAIRIAVNDELRQLVDGLAAAERALQPGGKLAVVTLHSIEDRIVKRFLADRASLGGGGSRHAPKAADRQPTFILTPKKAIGPDDEELSQNPRARSAKLRVATRTDVPASAVDPSVLGLPKLPEVF